MHTEQASGYPTLLVGVSYATSVRRCSCDLIVAVTVFVVNLLALIGVRMTLALCMIRASRLGGRMTQRYGWEQKDRSN